VDGSGYEGPDPTTAPTVGTSNTMDAERGHLYFAADGDISTLGQQAGFDALAKAAASL